MAVDRLICTLAAILCLSLAATLYLGAAAALFMAVARWDVRPLLGVFVGLFGGTAMLADGLIVVQMRRELTA